MDGKTMKCVDCGVPLTKGSAYRRRQTSLQSRCKTHDNIARYRNQKKLRPLIAGYAKRVYKIEDRRKE